MSTITEEPFRSYRVPRAHGDWMIDPPLDTIGDALTANQTSSAAWNLQIGSVPIAEFRRRARRELLETAVGYVRTYRDLPDACSACSSDMPLILAGHQPELFHPGVWFKNFVLSRLGESLSATSINLIVDNDICRSRSIRVPSLRSGKPAAETIIFDRPHDVLPFEMAQITDLECFRDFGNHVSETIRPLVPDPCVQQLWPHAVEAADRTGNVGLALAQSRHQLEAQIGLSTLEVPLSLLSGGESFCAFMLHLISNLPRLHDCYNESVLQYRRAHHIRSNSHPVPELAVQHDWFEAPLWIYDDANPHRRALFARVTDQQIELSDLGSTHLLIPQHSTTLETTFALMDQIRNSIRLRPRALVTTMYARLVLSDLFLHGIGGGKYDQLNDTIIRRFFDIQPPRFTVLSATFNPLAENLQTTGPTSEEIRQSIRSTYFQPERFAGNIDLPARQVDDKLDLLKQIPPRGSKQAWHDRITRINRDLSARMGEVRKHLTDQLRATMEIEAQRRLLASRDYSFCIYPLDEMASMFGSVT